MKNYSCMRAFKPPLAVALALKLRLLPMWQGDNITAGIRKSFNGIRACSRLRLEATFCNNTTVETDR
jgi:hypothetical protein